MRGLDSRLRCAGCGASVEAEEPRPFRCPRADEEDDVDHVLSCELDLADTTFPRTGPGNPFVRFRTLLHSYRWARRRGIQDEDFLEKVGVLDRAVAEVDGHGFSDTPMFECESLADELGVESLWIKDETRNVAGSHKARHLMGVALQLSLAECVSPRPATSGDEPPSLRLAVASCGNAALGAAVIARAAGWPLTAYVPAGVEQPVAHRLEELGTTLVSCSRSDGDGPGDPCARRFRAAVRGEEIPFTCQGHENGLSIEGGQTLVWELLDQLGTRPIDTLLVQVGGGALASACVQGLRVAQELGALAKLPRFLFVQPRAAHPLARAWSRIAEDIVAEHRGGAAPDSNHRQLARWLHERKDAQATREVLAAAARRRSRYMQPWEEEPRSAATGILDDETYDWRVLVEAMIESGGWPVLASEVTLGGAPERARAAAGVEVDATGAAGLAGLLELSAQGEDLEELGHTVVLFTGGRR